MTLSRSGLSLIMASAFMTLLTARSYASGTRSFFPAACNAGFSANLSGAPDGTTHPVTSLSSGPGQTLQANENLGPVFYVNSDANTPLLFYCPLITDTQINLPAPGGFAFPVTVTLFYNGGNNGVGTNGDPRRTFAKVCRTQGVPFGGTSTFCHGPSAAVSGARIYDLQPVVNQVPNDATAYFFLVVGLGPTNSGQKNQFWGYRITNP